LNLTIYDGNEKPVACDEDDGPLWERTPIPPYEDSDTPRGYLDFLTWQSRTVRLHPEADGDRIVIRRVSYSQGRVWTQVAGFYDPFTAYERVPEVGDRAVQLRENRDLWRDSAALFQFGETDQFRGPTCLCTLGNLVSEGQLSASERYRVIVAGARVESGQPNLIFWRHETLPLPLAYLDNVQLVESLKEVLRLAERVARILKAATYEAVIQIKKDLAPIKPDEAIRALDFTEGNDRSPKRRPDPIGNRVKSLAPDRGYWAQLEPRFRVFLERLALTQDDEGRRMQLGAWFHQNLALLAERAYTTIARALTKSQRDLHGVAIGEGYLSRQLRKVGKKYPKPASTHKETTHA
jgi:CRISPR system Cascade subunit CasA